LSCDCFPMVWQGSGEMNNHDGSRFREGQA